jgi:hypothetical protein
MHFKDKIRNFRNYTALTIFIFSLSSWEIYALPQGNLSDKKAQQGSSESNETEGFTPVAYIIQLSAHNASLASDYDDIARKNIFGIAWRGEAADNLKFAKQMGYHNIMYRQGMENLAQAKDIHFMFEKPENLMYNHLGIIINIEYAGSYFIRLKEENKPLDSVKFIKK